MATEMKKPVRLEINTSGAWKRLGEFDLADEDQTALVMDAAEELVKTLHNGGPVKACPTMRLMGVQIDVNGPYRTELPFRLADWHIETGWREVATGDPL